MCRVSGPPHGAAVPCTGGRRCQINKRQEKKRLAASGPRAVPPLCGPWLPFGDNKGMVGRDGGGISTMGYSDISACAFLAFRCPFCGDKCAFLFVVITFVGALYSVSVCLH